MSFPLEGFGQDGAENTDPVGTNDNTPTGGGHPAWQEILSAIPAEYHEAVQPALRKWDDGVRGMLGKYAPYQDLEKQGWTPDRLNMAVSVAQAVETNPRGFYEVLRKHLGDDAAQQVVENVQEGDEPSEGLPAVYQQKIDQLFQQQETIAQMILAEREEKAKKDADAQLAAVYDWMESQSPVFKALNTKNKDGFGAAEPFINGLLEAGIQPDKALQMFDSFVKQASAHVNKPKPPTILGGNGGVVGAGSRPKLGEASNADITNMVTAYLQAANNER